MASIKQQPTSFCFSSYIEDIVFSTEDDSGVLCLYIVAGGIRTNIFTETMFAGKDKTVTLSDLPSLVDAYAHRYGELTLECSFTDSVSTVSIGPVTILFSRADIGVGVDDTTAMDFVQHHFLTILNGEKLTADGRAELLSAYDCSSVTAIALVQHPSGTIETLTADFAASTTQGNISDFDVSPSRISSLLGVSEGHLISYTIEAGERRQDFRLVTDGMPPAPSLLFINSFGCEEFLHCVGTHKKESKYDRSSARFMGRLRNYRVTEDRQFTANTGWLTTAMADWADDLFRSESVCLWVNGQRGREVVLSDSKSEITNEDDHLPAFEFTYTYAQRIHNVMQPSRAGRIFDNTFDRTFN